LGPDLTNVASNPVKGKVYAAAFIKHGTTRMPDFHLNDTEVSEVVAFLEWVDRSGSSRVPAEAVNWAGSYRIEHKR